MSHVRLVLLLVAGIASGCPRERPKPEQALEAFLADIQYGRADNAWASLSEGTRKQLIDRHRALAETTPSPADETPAQILFGDLGLVVMSPPESIVVASPLGNEVMLRIAVSGGKSADIRMVREGAEWKVDLIRSLEPAPPLTANLLGTSTISRDVP